MKVIKVIVLIIVGLMSLAAGAAKLMRVPQEVAFFDALGLNPVVMTLIGAAQVVASVLLCVPRLRKPGAVLAGIGFLVSAIMILMNGQVSFAIVALIPVGLTVFLAMSKDS